VDAAIDRFQDAAVAKPGYAIPFRFLGEAQEKKGLKKQAIKSYQRYLDLYPHAEDGDKIRKKSISFTRKWKKRRESSALAVVAGAGLERPSAASRKLLVR